MAKLARKMSQSAALKDFVCKWDICIFDNSHSPCNLPAHEIIPGPAAESDEQIAGFLKQTFSTTWRKRSLGSTLSTTESKLIDV